jgi:hypothetical protein
MTRPWESIEVANDLLRRDREVLAEYEAALARTDLAAFEDRLRLFQADHERHIAIWERLVADLGGTPAGASGVAGAMRRTLTRIAGYMGLEATLRAMRTNEEIAVGHHEAALKVSLPLAVREVVLRHLLEERRHLEWLEQMLDRRVWEQLPAE